MSNLFSFSKIMLYFGLFMILIYIVSGSLLIFAPVITYAPKEFKVIFGIFFVLYGIFRFVRIYPKLINSNQDEDNE